MSQSRQPPSCTVPFLVLICKTNVYKILKNWIISLAEKVTASTLLSAICCVEHLDWKKIVHLICKSNVHKIL